MIGAWWEDLGAVRQATAESIRLCEILHLIQLIVELYDWPYFSEMRLASLLQARLRAPIHHWKIGLGGERPMLHLQDPLLRVWPFLHQGLLVQVEAVPCQRDGSEPGGCSLFTGLLHRHSLGLGQCGLQCISLFCNVGSMLIA